MAPGSQPQSSRLSKRSAWFVAHFCTPLKYTFSPSSGSTTETMIPSACDSRNYHWRARTSLPTGNKFTSYTRSRTPNLSPKSYLPIPQEIDFYPLADAHQWAAHPAPLKTAVTDVLSRSTVRQVSMVHYHFANAMELHSLFRSAHGLRDLALRRRALHSADVDSMPRAFTTADLTHLRSLDLTDSALTDFLRANAATLQKIEIMTESSERHDSEDADNLLGVHRLTTLRIRAQNTSTMHATLRLFGNLGHLTALRDVKHEIFQNIHASDEPTWRTLDAAFSSVFDAALSSASDAAFSSAFDATGTSSPTAVLEVTATKYTPKPRRHFHFGTPLEPRETLSEWMPGLVERGALKVVSWEDEEEA
ncbi:hypothetical protein C8R43DRAFT_1138831 [Mycena crocata]|nr:hypothetical protein C8R43DRAFT_1138831 [Mycena crocata]